MCGICGIVDFAGPPSADTVRAMTRSLQHRGPDAEGTCSYAAAVLGHRRLSILDLSESANQPMLSEDRDTALVFNGEIYNFQEIRQTLAGRGHRFSTSSDTEVLLRLYLEKGEAMLEELNGMFSVAIWDERLQRLLLARDRLGKKPLYYCHTAERLSFSSELSSLMHDRLVPRRLNQRAIFEYFLYDFIPAPHSVFHEVSKLPAGHMAIFDRDGLRIRRYWSPPEPDDDPKYSDAKEQLIELIADAVRLRLISDVPLGSFLSGGIDSTLVTAFMAAKDSERVKTFSISFPGTTHDESAWSDLAASALATDHKAYPVEYDIEGVLSKMASHFGEPFGDSSAIPTWHLCKHTRERVTVALSGDGGDELFAGYERYLARRFQVIYDLLPLRLRERIIEPFVEHLPATTDYYGTSLSKKLKLFVQASRRIREDPLAVIPRTFSGDEVRALTGIAYDPEADPVIEAARRWMGLDPVSRMQFTDIQTYLAEDILTKVDRMSMAHALEVRSPLLDYRVVEFACRLPVRFKIKGRTTKRILKDAARGLVPDPILARSKYGFQVPLGRWFKGELKDWAFERLMRAPHNLLDRSTVEAMWLDHQRGKADNSHKIWLILFFSEWYTHLA
ncbi:MAG: asparagine synthase (glutamine-hydrolyzing) [Desulfomonile tiedjei]|nr:asparagine synthase (glutamine-hydrolyzing) [Desulfomonile tiedjei]